MFVFQLSKKTFAYTNQHITLLMNFENFDTKIRLELLFTRHYLLSDSCLDFINNKRRLHQDTPDLEWDFVHEADAHNCAKDFNECHKNVHYYGAIFSELTLPEIYPIKDVCRITVNQV